MNTHNIFSLDDNYTVLAKPFGTPLVAQGWNWLPLNQFGLWAIMTWRAGCGHPGRSFGQRLGIGGLSMLVMLGSEWCHNLSHAAAARLLGRPMDALRIVFGMPLVIYRNPDDPAVTPRQHMLRALGGPLFNLAALGIALLARRFSRPGSGARAVADAAAGMNAFICAGGLLPIPQFDGGSLLKWALVEKGRSPQAAEEVVVRANRVTGVGLGLAAGAALKKRKRFLGVVLGLLAVLSLLVGFKILKE